jgi:epoxyqueuosine reductase QueG
METSEFPGKIWVVSHKPVAVAAGLGQMGLHRNVIHPRFGSFILLGTIFVDVELDQESRPVDYNPCVNCKLCVAACPVGAIRPDGGLDADRPQVRRQGLRLAQNAFLAAVGLGPAGASVSTRRDRRSAPGQAAVNRSR